MELVLICELSCFLQKGNGRFPNFTSKSGGLGPDKVTTNQLDTMIWLSFKFRCLLSLNLTVRTWKWMVGIRPFPFGEKAYFPVLLLLVSRRVCLGIGLQVAKPRKDKKYHHETNIAMENPPFWWYLPGKMGFSWAMLVSGRVPPWNFHKFYRTLWYSKRIHPLDLLPI